MAPPLRGLSSEAFPSPCASVGLGGILCEQKKLLVRRLSVSMAAAAAAADGELKETEVLWGDGDASTEPGSFVRKKAGEGRFGIAKHTAAATSSVSAAQQEEEDGVSLICEMPTSSTSSSSPTSSSSISSVSSSSSTRGYRSVAQYRAVSAGRKIPQRSKRAMAEQEQQQKPCLHHQHRRHFQSAPVQAPLWPKFMTEKAKGKMNGVNSTMANGFPNADVDEDGRSYKEDEDEEEEEGGEGEEDGEESKRDDREEGEEEDGERLPPHEFLAREYARSQRTTFSVCEGLGRTLKGRDLSRVRNAVWSQMGFAD